MTVKSVAKAERTTRGTVMAIALIGPAQGEWPATQNPLNIKHTQTHERTHCISIILPIHVCLNNKKSCVCLTLAHVELRLSPCQIILIS